MKTATVATEAGSTKVIAGRSFESKTELKIVNEPSAAVDTDHEFALPVPEKGMMVLAPPVALTMYKLTVPVRVVGLVYGMRDNKIIILRVDVLVCTLLPGIADPDVKVTNVDMTRFPLAGVNIQLSLLDACVSAVVHVILDTPAPVAYGATKASD